MVANHNKVGNPQYKISGMANSKYWWQLIWVAEVLISKESAQLSAMTHPKTLASLFTGQVGQEEQASRVKLLLS